MPSLPLIAYLLQGLGLGLTAGISPGPLQTFLVNKSLSGGWRSGFPVAFAPLISDVPIVLVILLLLNQVPPQFLRVISLVGGVYVFYLAWGLWGQWRQASLESPATPTSEVNNLWQGVLMNFLSPGPYIFWTLVNGPLLISALRQSWLYGLAFLLGFYGAFIGLMLGLVFIFDQARRLGPRVVRSLTLVSIIVLVIFGVILLASARG
jgi:threonine/homoserine/homoserine lactone efflux protein